MAVWRNEPSIVLHLLDQLKCNVDVPAKTQQTPLHLAIMKGYIHMVKILLDRNADLEAQDL